MIERHSEQEECAGISGERLSIDVSRGYRVGSDSWRVGLKHRDRGGMRPDVTDAKFH